MARVSFAVSGVAWDGGLDPHVTGVPDECGWPRPTRHRRWGRGYQAVYEDVPADPESAREGRAMMAAAERIRALVRDQGDG